MRRAIDTREGTPANGSSDHNPRRAIGCIGCHVKTADSRSVDDSMCRGRVEWIDGRIWLPEETGE